MSASACEAALTPDHCHGCLRHDAILFSVALKAVLQNHTPAFSTREVLMAHTWLGRAGTISCHFSLSLSLSPSLFLFRSISLSTALLLLYDVANKASFDNIQVWKSLLHCVRACVRVRVCVCVCVCVLSLSHT